MPTEPRTAAEALVVQRTSEALVADFTKEPGYDPDKKPVIRAAFLRRLMLGLEDGAQVRLPGVRVTGAHIEGALDLSDCMGPGGGGLPALVLETCDFPDCIDLSNARLARFSMDGSRFRLLLGNAVKVDGDFTFIAASPLPAPEGAASGYVRLRGARIQGDLYGRGARLVRPAAFPPEHATPETVLYLQAAEVSGNVLLDNGFHAEGCVWMLGARIGGGLQFSGANLSDPGGQALVLDGAGIGSALYFREGFTAKGRISAGRLRVGGALDLSGASVSAPDDFAIQLANAEIGGDALFNEGFALEGGLYLPGARIGGNLLCDAAKIAFPGNTAITAERIDIAGKLALTDSTVEGAIHLGGGRIGGDLFCDGATLKGGEGNAIHAAGLKIGGSALFTRNFSAEGQVTLTFARIDGSLVSSGRFADGSGEALGLGGAAIGADIVLGEGFHADGLGLNSASIGGTLECAAGRITAANGFYALRANAVKVGSSVSFGGGFVIEGGATFSNAKIAGGLILGDVTLSHPEGLALVVSHIELGGSLAMSKSTKIAGLVLMLNARIGGGVDCDGASLTGRGGSALVANGSTVGGYVSLGSGFTAEGIVSLFGVKAGGSIICDGGKFSNPDGMSLSLEEAEIEGSVTLRGGFEAKGSVNLLGARIGRDLEMHEASFAGAGNFALVLEMCRIGDRLIAFDNTFAGAVSAEGARADRLVDHPLTAWKGATAVRINAMTYEHLDADTERERPLWRQRAKWLRLNTGMVAGKASAFSNQPWRMAALAFERGGFYSDARRIARTEQCEANKHRAAWKRPFVWLFAELPFGYGLSASRAGITAALVWLLGWAGVEIALARGVLVREADGQYVQCGDAIAPPLYALDVAIPLLDLQQESECKPQRTEAANLSPGTPIANGQHLFEETALWRWAKTAYAILGALVIGFAVLTWSGVFRPRAKPD